MKAIAVVDENWGLGRDGKLLVHLPGDLRYFKEKTLGRTIVLGRETFEGMGSRPLAGRETVLLTRNRDYKADCRICHSLEELLAYAREKDRGDVFAAGGEMVYRLLLPFCDTVFVTKIYAAFAADRHFPNLDARPEEFEIAWRGEAREESGVRYQFFEYKRKNGERKKWPQSA